MNVVKDIISVVTVNSIAEASEENARYCDMYVGSQNFTVVLTTPVNIEINVNFMILCLIRTLILPPFSVLQLY